MTKDKPEPGPTLDFPEGQIGPDDEGGLNIAVGVVRGKVAIVFGTRVTWMAMGPDCARELAQLLMDRADAIEGGGDVHGGH